MTEEDQTIALTDSSIPPLSIPLGRKSYSGLRAMYGVIEEECNRDLQWPDCITTYKAMLKDATISSACNLMEMSIAKVKWKVKIPDGYEQELKEKARFLQSCMNDMDNTWVDFIRQAATHNRFGFAPIEKVYRKRTRKNGSKYDDGLYGIQELTLIAQDSIEGWEWNESGKKLTGLWQYKNIPRGKNKQGKNYIVSNESQFIRRAKFILFRSEPFKDSPIGTSPLNNVYMAWRYKTEYERSEAVSVATDARGLKVIYVPPNYLRKEASNEEKETAEHFKSVLSSLHNGEQSGVLLPMVYDETGKELFKFDVISVMGQTANDVDKIIRRLRNEIVTGLMYPSMTLGQDGSGSFALAESLEGISATVIEARLVEIRDQLNHDLIPQLFQLNGWDSSVVPFLDFEEVQRTNIGDWSSAVQRIASNGLIKLDAKTVNEVHSRLGFDTAYDDDNTPIEDIRDNATNFQSNSSEGMVSPSGQGTSKRTTTRDNSVANQEN